MSAESGSTGLETQDSLALAIDLVQALKAGERERAERIVEVLAEAREARVYAEIATMAQELRKALGDLEGDAGVAGMTLHEIPEVRDRLHYLVAKTERAAHRTIGSVEGLLPMAERIAAGAEKLIEDWSRIEWEGLDASNLGALRDRVIEVVGMLRGDSRALHAGLLEILVAQDYQDLTGQVIERVVHILQEVEVKLATMASLSGSIARPAGLRREEPERSDEPPAARVEVVSGQAEVDALLATLVR